MSFLFIIFLFFSLWKAFRLTSGLSNKPTIASFIIYSLIIHGHVYASPAKHIHIWCCYTVQSIWRDGRSFSLQRFSAGRNILSVWMSSIDFAIICFKVICYIPNVVLAVFKLLIAILVKQCELSTVMFQVGAKRDNVSFNYSFNLII